MATDMASSVECNDDLLLESIGPTPTVTRIPCPKRGGLIVLKGMNDLGKSEHLKAIDRLMGGPSKPSVTRGSLRGKAEGFGVTIKIAGGRTSCTGELEIESLEGRFSLDDLIHPQIKDPVAADKKRIEVLLQLTGLEPSPKLFHHLLGTQKEFEAIVGKAAIESDDVVLMASRIKTDIETAAQKEESQRDIADAHAIAAAGNSVGIDVTQEADSDELAESLETAIIYETKMVSGRDSAVAAEDLRRKAIDALKSAESSYHGPNVANATAAEQRTIELLTAADTYVRDLELQLAEAKQRAQLLCKDSESATQVLINAQRHEELVAKWRAQVSTPVQRPPNFHELAAATESVQLARKAVEDGALVRRAKQQLEAADAFSKEASLHAKLAIRFREAAAGVKEVLSGLVSQCGTPLTVEDGRLMIDRDSLKEFGLDHGRKGKVYYAELSHGTRSLLGAEIALKALGEGGGCTLRQEFYEGMAPKLKVAFAARVLDRGVKFYTAQATDDLEIVAEVFRNDQDLKVAS